MRGWPFGLAVWLLLLASVDIAALAAVGRFFVWTEHGQLLDAVALSANRIGQARVADVVDTVLNAVSVVWLVIATGVAGFIAVLRRRVALASGVIILVVGANVMTQVLKQLIYRPDLGVDPERAAAGNSLPSGHVAVAASVTIALMLVLPSRLRGFGAVAGAVFTAAVGVATLSAGWHRPSDAVAAVLVVGAWACAAGLYTAWVQHRRGGVERGRANRSATLVLVVAGLVLLAGAGLAVQMTDPVLSTPVEQLSRDQLLVAYAGGASFIAGVTSLVVASVLGTAHRVVPRLVEDPGQAAAVGV